MTKLCPIRFLETPLPSRSSRIPISWPLLKRHRVRASIPMHAKEQTLVHAPLFKAILMRCTLKSPPVSEMPRKFVNLPSFFNRKLDMKVGSDFFLQTYLFRGYAALPYHDTLTITISSRVCQLGANFLASEQRGCSNGRNGSANSVESFAQALGTGEPIATSHERP